MTKKKDENVTAVETEDLKAKFQEKLKELLEMGKKKRNILEYQEISDFFKDMNLDAEKMERVLDYLEHNGIDVLKMMDDLDDDDEIILDIDKSFRLDKHDVRLYLFENKYFKTEFVDVIGTRDQLYYDLSVIKSNWSLSF